MAMMKRQTAYKLNVKQILESEKDILDGKFKMLFVPNRNDKNKREVSRVNLIANVIEKFISDDKRFASLKLDDASGQIRIKTFGGEYKKIENVNIGDTVRVIGWIRYYNAELYVIPEIAKKVEPEWLLARKLELEKEYRNGISYDSSLSSKETMGEEQEVEKKEKQEEVKQETSSIISETPQTAEPQKIGMQEALESSGSIVESSPYAEKIEVPQQHSSSLRLIILEKIRDLGKNEDSGAAIDELIMALDSPVQEINETIEILLEEGIIFEPRPGRLKVL